MNCIHITRNIYYIKNYQIKLKIIYYYFSKINTALLFWWCKNGHLAESSIVLIWTSYLTPRCTLGLVVGHLAWELFRFLSQFFFWKNRSLIVIEIYKFFSSSLSLLRPHELQKELWGQIKLPNKKTKKNPWEFNFFPSQTLQCVYIIFAKKIISSHYNRFLTSVVCRFNILHWCVYASTVANY